MTSPETNNSDLMLELSMQAPDQNTVDELFKANPDSAEYLINAMDSLSCIYGGRGGKEK